MLMHLLNLTFSEVPVSLQISSYIYLPVTIDLGLRISLHILLSFPENHESLMSFNVSAFDYAFVQLSV